jgi:alpha-D-ribose 1-methylphosphonate 5-triphosphate synthase subunit PhnH
MLDQSVTGGFAAPSTDAAHVFRAALSAMARPGRVETLTGAQAPAPMSRAAAALVLTLCDAETPLYLAPGHDTAEIRAWVAFHTGAPIVAREQAQFAVGAWDALMPLAGYAIGTPEYPDRSATLIVEMEAVETTGHRLTGPGIETEAFLSLPDSVAFQNNRMLFPQGLDFYFTAGAQLAALPRTTHVEAG